MALFAIAYSRYQFTSRAVSSEQPSCRVKAVIVRKDEDCDIAVTSVAPPRALALS